MRRYESVWVVNGDLPDEEVQAAIDKFSRIISSQGTLVGLEEWGRRKLAYKIQGTTYGYYVLADFAGSSEAVKELERNYRIDDRILRYLTIKKTDQVDLESLQAEIAARAKAAAPAPSEAVAAGEAAAAPESSAEPQAAGAPEASDAPEPAAAPEEASSPEAAVLEVTATPEETTTPEETAVPAVKEE
jgi:small subunit ribosomal protein S6